MKSSIAIGVSLKICLCLAVTLEDIPNGILKTELLALQSKNNTAFITAMENINSTATIIHDTKYAHVTNTGMLFFTEPIINEKKIKRKNRYKRETSFNQTFQRVDDFNIPIHHSLPGCTNILWLNMQGGIIKNKQWNSNYGVNEYFALPYLQHTTEFGPKIFNDAIRDGITMIWQRIAADFAPFKIDVTTEKPPIFNETTGEAMFTPSKDSNGTYMPGHSDFLSPGGVAFLNVFGNKDSHSESYSKHSPFFVYNTHNETAAEAASHEMGHNLGLEHDKTIYDSYYQGHCSYGPTQEICWGPIMGTGYTTDVSQWSNGSHPGGTMRQNDLAIIDSKIGYRDDDAGNTFDTAVDIQYPSKNNFFINGIIETTSDIDMYKLDLSTAQLLLLSAIISVDVHGFTNDVIYTLNRYGVNLNTKLIIYNEQKSSICEQNLPLVQESSCNFATTDAAIIYISIQGVGDNSPVDFTLHNISVDLTDEIFFPSYGSLGDYKITFDLETYPGTRPPTTRPPTSGPPTSDSPTKLVDINWNLNSINITTNLILGDTIRWTWNRRHSIKSGTPMYPDTKFVGSTASRDGTFSFTPKISGTYPYYCEIHPTMTGVVIVASPQLQNNTNDGFILPIGAIIGIVCAALLLLISLFCITQHIQSTKNTMSQDMFRLL
jgi:hypothetical protein